MTEKLKERTIIISGSFIASMLVMLTGFALNANRIDDIDLKRSLDSKLPIERYEKDCEKDEIRFQRIEQLQISDRQDYIKCITAIQTDIGWIRKELESKKR